MKIINNYESSSIDAIEEKGNRIVVSPKKEKDGYANYYNFIISNLCNKEGTLVIRNLDKMKYIPREYNLLYKTSSGEYKKIDKDRIDIIDNEVLIKILKNEEIEISSYPKYTYSDLINYLDSKKIKYENIDDLIKIVIGDESKKSIFILGRQHPGETLSSFFIEGVLEYLINNRNDEYSFIIFPMVSVTGVKDGCHRYTHGNDYNRLWNKTGVIKEIDYIKNELSNHNVSTFVDVHGDEDDDFDYIRTSMKLGDNFAGIQVLKDRNMFVRIIRELIRQHKLPNLSEKTSREYVASIYKCDNILIELSLCDSTPKKVKEEGCEFIKKLIKR